MAPTRSMAWPERSRRCVSSCGPRPASSRIPETGVWIRLAFPDEPLARTVNRNVIPTALDFRTIEVNDTQLANLHNVGCRKRQKKRCCILQRGRYGKAPFGGKPASLVGGSTR